MMTTNLFVITNVKQLRTGSSFRILLPFFPTSWGVGILNSTIFNSFHSFGWVWHDFGGRSEFQGGGFNPPNPSLQYATSWQGLYSPTGKLKQPHSHYGDHYSCIPVYSFIDCPFPIWPFSFLNQCSLLKCKQFSSSVYNLTFFFF